MRRTRRWLAAMGAVGLTTSVVGAGSAGAAPAPAVEDVVIITTGHTDAWFPQVDTADDGTPSAHLRMHDDTYGTLEWADVVVHNGDESRMTLPDDYTPDSDMSFFAPPGSEVWVSPDQQDPDLPWLGVETGHESLDYMYDPPQALHLRLDAVRGLDGGAAPGELVIWEYAAPIWGDRLFYSTVKGIPGGRGMGNGGHGHYNWGVTAPGVYCAGFTLGLPLPNGERGSDFQWLTLVYGDAFDPEEIVPCGRVLDEPTDVPMHEVDLRTPAEPVVSSTTMTAIDLRLVDGELDVLWREEDRYQRSRGTAYDIDDVIVLREAYGTDDADRVAAMTQRDLYQRRGWDTTDVRVDDVAGEITWRIDGIDGPGHLRVDRELPAIPVFDTDPAVDRLEYEVITGHATHLSAWTFSQPGRYCIDMEWSVPLPDGSVATQDTVLTWLEDGPVDPAAPSTIVNGVPVYEGALLSEDPANLEPCVAQEPPAPAASQTISATLDESQGALIVSVDPDDRAVVMAPAQLDEAGDRWEAEGELRPVTVVDTRSAAPGWVVSGQASPFVGDEATYEADHLGWTPTADGVADVQPGPPVAPGPDGGDGLSVSATLASAPEGSGTGTSVLGASLRLELPTYAPLGAYESVLTITAI